MMPTSAWCGTFTGAMLTQGMAKGERRRAKVKDEKPDLGRILWVFSDCCRSKLEPQQAPILGLSFHLPFAIRPSPFFLLYDLRTCCYTPQAEGEAWLLDRF